MKRNLNRNEIYKKINCIILVLFCMITASFADIVFAADSTGGIIVVSEKL